MVLLVNLVISHSMGMSKEISWFKFYCPKVVVTAFVWISLYCYVFSEASEFIFIMLKNYNYLNEDSIFNKKSKIFYLITLGFYTVLNLYYCFFALRRARRLAIFFS